MNNKVAIWIIALFVLVSSSYAINMTANLVGGYNFTATSGSVTGFYNGTVSGTMTAFSGDCIAGTCVNDTTASSYLGTTMTNNQFSNNITLSCWLKGGVGSGTQYWWGDFNGGSNEAWTAYYTSGGIKSGFVIRSATAQDFSDYTIGTYPQSVWRLHTFTWQRGTTMKQYIDAKEVISQASTTMDMGTASDYLLGSVGGSEASGYVGLMDECYFWNRILTSDEILCLNGTYTGCTSRTYPFTTASPPPSYNSLGFPTTPTPATGSTLRVNNFPINITVNTTYANNNITLWNSTGKVASTIIGAGNNQLISFPIYYASGTQSFYFNGTNNETSVLSATTSITINTAPIFSVATPANNSQFAVTNITFTTYANNSIPFNATFYLNGVANETKEIAAGTNINVSFNKIIATGTTNTFSINGTTWDNSRNTTTTNLFYVDTVTPVIASTFVENITALQTNLLTAQFNFTDETVLFSWNVTIDGVIIGNQSGLSSTFYQYNMSYNMSGFPYGPHQLRTRVTDGHTAEILKEEYEISDGLFNDKLVFSTSSNDIEVSKKSKSISDTWQTTKELDRYSFSIESSDKSSTQTFVVETEDPIYIINRPDLEYKSWIVSGNHWIDFKVKDQEDFEVDIVKLSETTAEVTVSNIKNPEFVQFESIGELNVYEKNYTFYTFNASISYAPSVIETNPTTFFLTVFKNSSQWSISNVLGYVNSVLISNSLNVSNSSYDIYMATYAPGLGSPAFNTLSWNFTATPQTYVLSAQQAVVDIMADNCTNSTFARALNFTLLDEVNRTRINGTLNIALTMVSGNLSQPVIFNQSFSGKDIYSICISPSDATYNVSAIAQFTSPGYQTRGYYILGMTINNVTQTVPLLNIPVSVSSIVQTKIYDAGTSLPIEGGYVSLLRYYPETNSYETVEIEQSDALGFSTFSLVPYNTFYKFIVNYNGAIVLNDNARTIYTGITSLPIQLSPDLLYSLQYVNGVAVNVSCNQNTLVCSFFWSDTNNVIQSTQLDVYRVSGFGQQLISSQTSSSPSGQLMYTITENTTGNNYMAVGYINSVTQGSVFDAGRAMLSLNDNFTRFGTGGTVIYSALMIIMVMGLIMIDIGPAGIIFGSWAGLLFGALLGIIPITWTALLGILLTGGAIYWFSKS